MYRVRYFTVQVATNRLGNSDQGSRVAEKILLLNWLIVLQILQNSSIPLFTNLRFSRSVKRNVILYNSRTILPCHRQKAEARELRTEDLLRTRSETLKTRLKTKSETKLDLILPTIFSFQ